MKEEEKLYVIRKSMLIMAAGREHQVLPGVIELMKFLYSKQNVTVAFFSSGMRERNIEFVKELLIRSLGSDIYKDIESSIIILSKEDLSPSIDSESRIMRDNFDISWGNYRNYLGVWLSK